MDITILELHFPNAEFYAPFATDHADDNPSAGSVDRESHTGRGALAVSLLVLIGLAALAQYLRKHQNEIS